MLNSKTFEIFNGTVTVTLGIDYIKKYEEHVGPFTNKTAEYLAVTSGYDESYSNEDIIKGIEEGINEEVSIYDDRDDIVCAAIEKGFAR